METDILQEVELKILKNKDCKKISGFANQYNISTGKCDNGLFISFAAQPTLATEDQLCAMAPGKSGCSGDSGGPLTVKKDGRHYLAGVYDWHIDCSSVS